MVLGLLQCELEAWVWVLLSIGGLSGGCFGALCWCSLSGVLADVWGAVWLEGRRLSSLFAGVAFLGSPHKQVGLGAVTLSVGLRWVSLHSDAPPPWC